MTLTVSQILEADLPDWRLLRGALHARFRTGGFRKGLALVAAVGEAAERVDHHPDVTLTYPYVQLKLTSHDAGRVTQRDLDLAATVSQIAAEQGVDSELSAVAELELGLDTADLTAAGPFWAALLGGTLDGHDVVTPGLPSVWFQTTDAHETPRQRFHVDLWVPHDVAPARIAAAVAAGGTLVDDAEAPAFTVLADPEGNRACVCTCLGR